MLIVNCKGTFSLENGFGVPSQVFPDRLHDGQMLQRGLGQQVESAPAAPARRWRMGNLPLNAISPPVGIFSDAQCAGGGPGAPSRFSSLSRGGNNAGARASSNGSGADAPLAPPRTRSAESKEDGMIPYLREEDKKKEGMLLGVVPPMVRMVSHAEDFGSSHSLILARPPVLESRLESQCCSGVENGSFTGLRCVSWESSSANTRPTSPRSGSFTEESKLLNAVKLRSQLESEISCCSSHGSMTDKVVQAQWATEDVTMMTEENAQKAIMAANAQGDCEAVLYMTGQRLDSRSTALIGLATIENRALDSEDWRQMLSAGSAAGLASSAAKSHPEDPKVVAASMRVISAISVNGDNQLRAAQDGALEVVVEALKGVECEEVAYESCVALSRLVESHMGNKCVVADLGGATALVNAMKRHTASERVQVAACDALCSLAYVPAVAAQVVRRGAVGTTAAAVAAHSSSSRVAEAGLRLIMCLSQYAPNALQFALSEALHVEDMLKVVSAAMSRHAQSEVVERAGCKIIASLASMSGVQSSVEFSACIDLVIAAMGTHISSRDIQEAGCASLCGLCFSAANRLSIVARGGLPAIVSAMGMHREAADVQVVGCNVFCYLSFDEESLLEIGLCGGVSAVLASMAAWKEDRDVQRWGFWALSNLAGGSSGDTKFMRVRVVQEGGVEAAISAMRRHVIDAEVVEQACGLLVNVGMVEGVTERTRDSDGILAVKRVMASHRSHREVQKWGCGVLYHVSCDQRSRILVYAVGGVNAVVQAMRSFPGDPGVQEVACLVLASLSVEPEAAKIIAASGGITVLVCAVARHEGEADVQRNGCAAVFQLAKMSLEVRARVGECNGVEAVLRGLRANLGDAEVVGNAAATLGILMRDTHDNVAACANAGGMEMLSMAMEAHPGVGVVRGACTMALNALGRSPAPRQKGHERSDKVIISDDSSGDAVREGHASRRLGPKRMDVILESDYDEEGKQVVMDMLAWDIVSATVAEECAVFFDIES